MSACQTEARAVEQLLAMQPIEFILAGVAIAATILSTPAAAAPSIIEGKVVHVEDGDTVVLLDQQKVQHKIRLADVDAPETCHRQHDHDCRRKPGQPFGDKARLALAEWTKGRQVAATCRGVVRAGRDDREVCYLHIGAAGDQASSVNYELVRNGLAWVETRFAKDRRLFALGEEARRQRLGLWSMPHPVEPREWRASCWSNGHCPQ